MSYYIDWHNDSCDPSDFDDDEEEIGGCPFCKSTSIEAVTGDYDEDGECVTYFILYCLECNLIIECSGVN